MSVEIERMNPPTLLVCSILYALEYCSLKEWLIFQASSLGFHLSIVYEYTLLLDLLVPSSILGGEELMFFVLFIFLMPHLHKSEEKILFKPWHSKYNL